MLSETVDLEFLKEFQKIPPEICHDMWNLRYGEKVVHIPDNGIKDFWVSTLKHSGLFHWMYEHKTMDTYFKLKERSNTCL